MHCLIRFIVLTPPSNGAMALLNKVSVFRNCSLSLSLSSPIYFHPCLSLPVPNSLYGLCGRKATFAENSANTTFRMIIDFKLHNSVVGFDLLHFKIQKQWGGGRTVRWGGVGLGVRAGEGGGKEPRIISI